MPTLLLVSANDPDNRLNQLSNEIKEIQRTLNKTFEKGYDVVLTPDASIQDLIEELRIPNREIEVLHYAGHADTTLIQLADGNADAAALAEKLQHFNCLKLVFLNGCATRGQVDFFHKAGIPFVIATSCKIGDDKAYLVSTQVYQYLCLGRSLREACQEVETDVRKLQKKADFVATRALVSVPGQANEETDAFPWGLYCKPGAEQEDYRLPFTESEPQGEVTLNQTSFLNKLIQAMAKIEGSTMAGIRSLAPNLARGNVPDNRKISELLKVLPLPIATRLRDITALVDLRNDEYYRGLLYDYAVFFDNLLQYAAAILLAQLWQLKQKPNPELATTIQHFLQRNHLQSSAVLYRDLLPALNAARTPEWNAQFNPLPAETLDYLASPAFEMAADFFWGLKKYYWQRVRLREEESVRCCYQAQEQLSEAFLHFRTELGLVMASVRDIKVINQRYVSKEFDNIISKLLLRESDPLPQTGVQMLENRSILCFPEADFGVDSPSLNLFPFLIDRNVFLNQSNTEVDIYLFAGYYQPEGYPRTCFHFVSVDRPGEVWRFDESLEEISLLNIGEISSQNHEANHLMTNTWELKHYLNQFKAQFLTA
ncbi:MAG: CHAT domain-containing protein [Haliscomenobacter sp.]|uniref:CHAT domain-containing protein n=1 Tax=Haliscomenobacter sp. TaxID=2717303 RepID=UPI0029A947E5|nr:CHAT domain-containing protein [Haliscomenobacter sp.]MDX2068504.1 CHAT domain-containing protein [Haliscomenobacter sp.]